jgi:hypothetical protein
MNIQCYQDHLTYIEVGGENTPEVFLCYQYDITLGVSHLVYRFKLDPILDSGLASKANE